MDKQRTWSPPKRRKRGSKGKKKNPWAWDKKKKGWSWISSTGISLVPKNARPGINLVSGKGGKRWGKRARRLPGHATEREKESRQHKGKGPRNPGFICKKSSEGVGRSGKRRFDLAKTVTGSILGKKQESRGDQKASG